MEQNKKQKWYPVEYSGFWQIQNCEEYDGLDMLDADDVGAEQAKENAILCSQAPEWKKVADTMYEIIKKHVYITQITPKQMEDINKYEKLCKI